MKGTTYLLAIVSLALVASAGGQTDTAINVPGPGDPLATARSSGTSVVLPARGVSTPTATDEAVMVIAAGGMSAETRAQLHEDMNIMCRIFDRFLENAGLGTADRRSLFTAGDRRFTRGMYLPDFGPVFLVQVDFPLLPGPQIEPPPAEESGDALWREVRQQMQGRSASDAPGDIPASYDELKVESLRRTLADAMKHASNIRGLDPNNRIVAVAVNGPPAPLGPAGLLRRSLETRMTTGVAQVESRSLHVLSLQATKASVDAYAAARITQDQFRKQASIATYEVPPMAAGSGRATVPQKAAPVSPQSTSRPR